MAPVSECLAHWKRKLIRNESEDKTLDVLRKLYKVPITIELLQEIDIIKIIKQLCKQKGAVGCKASELYVKWKKDITNSEREKLVKQKEANLLSHSKSQDVLKNGKSNHHVQSDHDVQSEEEEALNDYSDGPQSHTLLLARSGHSDSASKSKKHHNSSHSPDKKHHSSRDKHNLKRKESSSHRNSESANGINGVKQHVSLHKHESSKHKHQSPDVQHRNTAPNSESCKAKQTENCERTDKIREKIAKEKTSEKVLSFGCYALGQNEKEETRKVSKEAKIKSGGGSKKLKISETEAFTASEVSFEDCLGFNDIVPSKKKKPTVKLAPTKKSLSCPLPQPLKSSSSSENKKQNSNGKHSITKPSKVKTNTDHHESKKHLKRSSNECKMSKLDDGPSNAVSFNFSMDQFQPKLLKGEQIDISSTLPEIQPNYRPLPRVDYDIPLSKRKTLSNEEVIMFTSSRRDKTAVYSGRRNIFRTEVASLFDICTRVIIENIEDLGYIGGVPYFILKPVLERCSPQQLYGLEDYNPYLLDDTNELWERHCSRDYKNKMPEEGETWRDVYLRVHEERQKKLESITANISANISKSNPVRQVKLAYVDSVAKPPRDVARRQMKHGTGLPVNHPMKAAPPSKASPRPTMPGLNSALSEEPSRPSKSSTASFPAPKAKPKVAPLMAKTLKCLKMGYRR